MRHTKIKLPSLYHLVEPNSSRPVIVIDDKKVVASWMDDSNI